MPAQPQPIVVGGTYDWMLNPATINTEAAPNIFGPWDLTNATVTISFAFYGNGQDAPPTTAAQHFGATVLSGPNGTAHYINTTSLFNASGTWGVSWKIVNGSTVLESKVSFFTVFPSLAAL